MVQDSNSSEEGCDQNSTPSSVPTARGKGRPHGSRTELIQFRERITTCDLNFLEALACGEAPTSAAANALGPISESDACRYARGLRARLQALTGKTPHASDLESVLEALHIVASTISYRVIEESCDSCTWHAASHPLVVEWLRTNAVVKVMATDALADWIHPSIASRFEQQGVKTVAQAVKWINCHGHSWYQSLPYIGKGLATRFLVWLGANAGEIGMKIDTDLLACRNRISKPAPPHRRTSVTVEVAELVYGIVPLERFAWPGHLLGEDGILRNPASTWARDDQDALNAWKRTIQEKSQDTRVSFYRAVELLALWALVERRKPLSSLSAQDLGEFLRFLRKPPGTWIQQVSTRRSSKDWRPLRGPLAPSGVGIKVAALFSFFDTLWASGYLLGNPAGGLPKHAPMFSRLDLTRSFSLEELTAVHTAFDFYPDGQMKRRLRAIILLLQTTGIRLSEIGPLRWRNVVPIPNTDGVSDRWALHVSTSTLEPRLIPLPLETIAALNAHLGDRISEIELGKLPGYHHLSPEDCPLISILRASPSSDEVGALQAEGCFRIVKDFFEFVSKISGEHGARVKNASPHWLRHTFALQTMDSSGLRTVHQLLGHAKVGTTALYSEKPGNLSKVCWVQPIRLSAQWD